MIAPYDKVGAAVVLADERVEDRLARTRISHPGSQRAEQDPILREKLIEQNTVTLDDRPLREITRFLPANQGMYEQTVGKMQGAPLMVLMRQVGGVARLEADDGFEVAPPGCLPGPLSATGIAP